MKNKFRVGMVLVLALTLILAMSSTAMAAGKLNVDPVADKGSVSVTLVKKDSTTKVSGLNVTLYQVGSGKTENNNLVFELVDALASTRIKLNGLTAEANTNNAKVLKEAIDKLEEGATVPTWTEKTNEAGVATFENLPVGVYLVVSGETANYKAIVPFLLQLPYTNADGDGWVLDVVSQPKVEGRPYYPPYNPPSDPPEEEIPEEDPPTTNPPEYPPEYPTEYPPEEEIPDEEPPLAELPQTGLLQWPIPVMAAAGLALMAIGAASERKQKAEQ